MALEFTDLPDKAGVATYILADTTFEQDRWRLFIDETSKHTTNQVLLVDKASDDARKIIDFYDLEKYQLPLIALIADDDTLHSVWGANEIPTPETVAFSANQISS
jgi:hypothetical protein